jgi:hypothetical protein
MYWGNDRLSDALAAAKTNLSAIQGQLCHLDTRPLNLRNLNTLRQNLSAIYSPTWFTGRSKRLYGAEIFAAVLIYLKQPVRVSK